VLRAAAVALSGIPDSTMMHNLHVLLHLLLLLLLHPAVYRTDTAARTHFDHIFKSGAKWTMCFALGKPALAVL
jgi:hypothetical protein